jgi:hypothetical protein
MLVGFFQGERSADEAHLAMIEETILIPSGTVWLARHLGAASQVYTSQVKRTTVLINELGAADINIHGMSPVLNPLNQPEQ